MSPANGGSDGTLAREEIVCVVMCERTVGIDPG